ncbi:hypothetical protein SDC9_101246 [bioreactor metagenome]|uniref:Uncharacterized protein n=1 Tax=bioreactor metagenome TaxID=1076179 RepID=A0A645ANX6_9ZZZZ
MHVLGSGLQSKPVLEHRLHMRLPPDQRHMVPCPRQHRPKVTTHRTSAHHRNRKRCGRIGSAGTVKRYVG